jgi:hypothetical protein
MNRLPFFSVVVGGPPQLSFVIASVARCGTAWRARGVLSPTHLPKPFKHEPYTEPFEDRAAGLGPSSNRPAMEDRSYKYGAGS